MTWDGQPLNRNLGGDGEEPKIPFGRWQDFFGGAPKPPPELAMPADPFNGLTEPAVAQVAMIEAVRDAGLPEPSALFYVACLVQVGLAVQQGGLGQPPQEPEQM